MTKKKPVKKISSSKPAAAKKSAPARGISFSRSELSSIQKTLLNKREEINNIMRKNQDMEPITAEVGDEADQAGQSLEKEMLFEVSDTERMALDQIEGALRKLEKGNYGLCESCQKPIMKERLKAMPFARYCIGCQNTSERAVFS
ncbi:MAG: TraR/DksA family transcriptional regulator [Elusimicrobiota bacterium]|jgi:DnaK suppressor protein